MAANNITQKINKIDKVKQFLYQIKLLMNKKIKTNLGYKMCYL